MDISFIYRSKKNIQFRRLKQKISDNGHYVDVNDNEIGFISQSTAAVQRADRWRAANRLPLNPPMKPRRTFADFQANLAPHLDFMFLNHNVSSFSN